MKRHSGYLFLFAASCLVLLVGMLSYTASLSRQLHDSQTQVANLQDQLRIARQQQCHQPYPWQSNTHYPATVESSGGTRSYTVRTPASYTADQRYPLIIVLDGMDGSPSRAELESGLSALPALTVYPEALLGRHGLTAWQGAPYSPEGVNDVQFIDDMLTALAKDYCIDTDRTYIVGMSNGAGLATMVTCDLGERIAGMTGISGAYYAQCPHALSSGSRLLFIHSRDDQTIPLSGSQARRLPDIYQLADSYGQSAGCQSLTTTRGGRDKKFSWSNCRHGQRIELIETRQQPHGWLRITDRSPTAERVLVRRTTSAVVWDFFTAP